MIILVMLDAHFAAVLLYLCKKFAYVNIFLYLCTRLTMRNALLHIGLLVGILGMWGTMLAAKRPVTDVERLTLAVKKTPGDMALRCELVQALLADGDTIAAEDALAYALKMDETACLFIKKAQLCLAKDDSYSAARYCAKAVKTGQVPEEETLIYTVDSLSDGAVTMYVLQLASEDKQNITLWNSLAQLASHRADTIAALRYYETAYHLGDSTAQASIRLLRDTTQSMSASDSVIARIPFTYQDQNLEIKGNINGLAIRIMVDTTATKSSISGVETKFMLKNEYLSKDDIYDDTSVVIKRLDLGNGMLLNDLLLHHISAQEHPIILCLRDLKRLGRIHVNKQQRVIEIVQ